MTGRIVASLWRRSALLCFLFTAITQAAAAQGIAGSFEQLQVLVKPGDTLIVTDTEGREITGKIAGLSPSSLTLLAGGARREWAENDVTTIRQRRADSLGNGAIYGLAIGAGFAATLLAVVAAVDEHEGVSGSDVAIILGAYGAIGAGAGVGVDALIRRRHVIYQRPSTSGVQVEVAPWLTSQRKGVRVTLRF
jgi:hypothetical protein